MSRRRILDNINIDPKHKDISNWPIVNIMQLQPEDREIFKKREAAVKLYMLHEEVTLEIITEQTGVSKKELIIFIKKCLEFDPITETIWGFRALIPHKRTKKYDRSATTTFLPQQQRPRFSGAFNQLLEQYPEIREKITSAYLRRKGKNSTMPTISTDGIHRLFLSLCKKKGLGIHDYPFNTNDKGYRSLYRFFKKIENNHFSEGAKRYGKEAARQSRMGTVPKHELILQKPFQRVQFDGHKIDAMFTITFKTPEGDLFTEVVERVWLLVIVDVATRAILGHHLCVNKEYNKDDVLHCIRNTVTPYEKRKFSIPGIDYDPKGGIPSAEIPETAWALWDEFSYDNGKANLSNIVTDRLYEVVRCTLNPGPVEAPEVRGIIERLFRSLEVLGYHKLVSTTGSNPSDPLRKNPEQQAKKFDISLSELEELTHILVSDYNGIPHSGIRNFSPLQLMKQRIERGMEPRVLEPEKRKDAIFFMIQTKRRVSGDIAKGKRPFINYEGVRYQSDILGNSPHLIGTELTIVVNVDDIRTVKVFLSDGSEFGYLTAYGIWGITPHSLRTRKAINKLKNERKIFFTTYQDPFQIYYEYKASKAKTGKRERNQIAQLQRELNKAELASIDNHEKEEEQFFASDVQSKGDVNSLFIEEDDDNDRIFRTYNF